MSDAGTARASFYLRACHDDTLLQGGMGKAHLVVAIPNVICLNRASFLRGGVILRRRLSFGFYRRQLEMTQVLASPAELLCRHVSSRRPESSRRRRKQATLQGDWGLRTQGSTVAPEDSAGRCIAPRNPRSLAGERHDRSHRVRVQEPETRVGGFRK